MALHKIPQIAFYALERPGPQNFDVRGGAVVAVGLDVAQPLNHAHAAVHLHNPERPGKSRRNTVSTPFNQAVEDPILAVTACCQ